MKAWALHDIGNIRLEDIEKPEVGTGEVLVAVKAAGICGSDIPRIYKTGAYSHPLIPGHEFSGIVTEIGAGVEDRWLGKRVGIFPLIPCRTCVPCQRKQYEMCRQYGYLGSRRDGGFAELTAVPVGNLIELPDTVSFEEAAMLEPMAVAVHAMRRISPKSSDTVTVCGLGTIGLLLLMFLREAGIENILAVGNKTFQKRMVLEAGLSADNFCNSKETDVDTWLMERTGGKGTDIFFECVGTDRTLTYAIANTAPAGRVMLVGNPASNMTLEKTVYWKILRNQLTVMGTWNSSFTFDAQAKSARFRRSGEDQREIDVPVDDWRYVLERLGEGKIRPECLISHRYTLEELEQGFHIMRDKTQNYGKVMMCMEE